MGVKKHVVALAALLFGLIPLEGQAESWLACGNITQIGLDCQLPDRPSTSYEYAIAYNTSEPQPILCSYWNSGRRIYNRHPYITHSDNPIAGMRWGGFIFYTGTLATDDDTCPEGSWRHRYYTLGGNNSISVDWTNGCYGSSLVVYCRQR